MKLVPRSLLGRTALYLGIILVVGSVAWTAAIGYFLLRPLRHLFDEMVAETIMVAQSALEHNAADVQRLNQKFTSFYIVPEGDPLPPFFSPSERKMPEDILERLRKRLGNEISLEQERENKNVWIKFPAGGRFYWLAVRVDPPASFPPPILIWVVGGLTMSIGGAYLIIYQLSRRLQRVTEAARAFGQRRVLPSLEETGPQEIRDLSVGFNQMANDIRQQERGRRLMLAGISHDLRTPLTRLRIAAELAATQTDPELAAGLIHDIEEMDAILKQFLDYARDGSEEMPAEASLNEIVREICLRYTRAGHGIGVELGNVPAFAFRPLALRRVVTNLIENAVRYGRESIEVRTELDGDHACIEVSDRGPGVVPERLKDIDQPFVRGSAARSELGAGLGLAIVDRIVRAHSGRMELKNRPEGGFIARVELPTSASKTKFPA